MIPCKLVLRAHFELHIAEKSLCPCFSTRCPSLVLHVTPPNPPPCFYSCKLIVPLLINYKDKHLLPYSLFV